MHCFTWIFIYLHHLLMYPPHCIMHWNIVFTWLQSKQDRSWLNILKLTCFPCVTLIFSREPATVDSVGICNGCLSAPVCIKEQISDWRYNLWPGVCLKCKNWWQRTHPRPFLLLSTCGQLEGHSTNHALRSTWVNSPKPQLHCLKTVCCKLEKKVHYPGVHVMF